LIKIRTKLEKFNTWIYGFFYLKALDKLHNILYIIVMDRKEPLKTVFFETESGNQPVRAFLLERSREDRKEIGSDIFKVQKGFPLGLPLVRKIDSGLWEIRSDIHDGICRIIFTIHQEVMVLLHGFVKKSQKIPSEELETGKKRLSEFRRLIK
jgi:phage-related protein